MGQSAIRYRNKALAVNQDLSATVSLCTITPPKLLHHKSEVTLHGFYHLWLGNFQRLSALLIVCSHKSCRNFQLFTRCLVLAEVNQKHQNLLKGETGWQHPHLGLNCTELLSKANLWSTQHWQSQPSTNRKSFLLKEVGWLEHRWSQKEHRADPNGVDTWI